MVELSLMFWNPVSGATTRAPSPVDMMGAAITLLAPPGNPVDDLAWNGTPEMR